MGHQPFAGVRIVGAGQTLYEKKSTKPVQRIIWEAADAGLRSAGLGWKKVDGLALTCFVLPPDNVTTIAEQFGIEARFLFQGLYGGASSIIGMMHAARTIRDGDADVVLCVAADTFDVAAHNAMLDNFNGSVRDYMSPYGFGGANGMFALHTRLYMERHGARREDFGRLAVAQRENALRNPNALFKSPLTMDEYLNARQIADPLRLYDCVMPCVGGDCVVLASERVARDLPGPHLKILAGGEYHNFPAGDVYSLSAGWEGFSGVMYERAQIGPKDLHFAQLYDDYPVMEFIQLEGLGISPKGRTHEWLRRTDVTWRGDFPINTGGGQLSAGQAGASGGMIGVVEGALQLRGEAGERQVRCKRGVVSGYGMVAYGRGLSASAAILERVN
jgi:acetyl-CoA acetyltransferase